MVISRKPGPLDPIRELYNVEDGTLARHPSPLPGPLNVNVPGWNYRVYKTPKSTKIDSPSIWDHFEFPGQSPLGLRGDREYYEKYFEKKIPQLLASQFTKFVDQINTWAKKNPTKKEFKGEVKRYNNDGDGQSYIDRWYRLGQYSIDLESPFPIERTSNGGFKWKTHMYVEDVQGASELSSPGKHWAWNLVTGPGWQMFAPDNKVKLARWPVKVDCTNPKQVIMISPFSTPQK